MLLDAIVPEKYKKKKPLTRKWIFEDLMPGDRFVCIHGIRVGHVFILEDILYKKRRVYLRCVDKSFGEKYDYLALNEDDFNANFNFYARHF